MVDGLLWFVVVCRTCSAGKAVLVTSNSKADLRDPFWLGSAESVWQGEQARMHRAGTSGIDWWTQLRLVIEKEQTKRKLTADLCVDGTVFLG